MKRTLEAILVVALVAITASVAYRLLEQRRAAIRRTDAPPSSYPGPDVEPGSEVPPGRLPLNERSVGGFPGRQTAISVGNSRRSSDVPPPSQ